MVDVFETISPLIHLVAGSYGNLARFKDLKRLRTVGDHTVIGAGGEYSDFQHIMELLDSKT